MVIKNTTNSIERAAADAVRIISEAAQKATSTIASAAESAAKVVANTAENQARSSGISTIDDHNLLTRLDTKFDLLKTTVDRIDAKDSSYITKEDWIPHLARDEKHETDIKELQSFRDTLVGKMWGIGLLAGLILSIISFVANHYSK